MSKIYIHTMLRLGKFLKLTGAVVLAGVAGTLYYFLRYKDTGWIKKEVEVPADVVPCIIGRKGASVKLIEVKTQTKIHFDDCVTDSRKRICVIRGAASNTSFACAEVQRFIEAHGFSSYVDVPAPAVSRLIGTGGRNKREIMERTGVVLSFESHPQVVEGNTYCRIKMSGSAVGVAAAKEHIQQKVQHITAADQRRHHWQETLSTRLKEQQHVVAAFSEEEGSGELSVVVCSVASPTSLFVQIVGPKSCLLSSLTASLTAAYGDAEARAAFALRRPPLTGDVVAAMTRDGGWGRARVLLQLDEPQDYKIKQSCNSNGGVIAGIERLPESDAASEEICDIGDARSNATRNCDTIDIDNTQAVTVGFNGDTSSISDSVEESNMQYDVPDKRCDETVTNGAVIGDRDCTSTTVPTSVSATLTNVSVDTYGENSSVISLHDSDNSVREHTSTRVKDAAVVAPWYLVFFVDTGVCGAVPGSAVCVLRTDLLRLSHQAVLVQLAGLRERCGQGITAEYQLSTLLDGAAQRPLVARVLGYTHGFAASAASDVAAAGVNDLTFPLLSSYLIDEEDDGVERLTVANLRHLLKNEVGAEELTEVSLAQRVKTLSQMTYMEVDELLQNLQQQRRALSVLSGLLDVLKETRRTGANLKSDSNGANAATGTLKSLIPDCNNGTLATEEKEKTANCNTVGGQLYIDIERARELCTADETRLASANDLVGEQLAHEIKEQQVLALQEELKVHTLELLLRKRSWPTPAGVWFQEALPTVQLLDSRGKEVVDIGREMMKRGVLLPCHQ